MTLLRKMTLIAPLTQFTTLGFGADQDENLETIVVIGSSGEQIQSELAGSMDVLVHDELAYEHVDDTLELFSKFPGVYLSRYNQGIINTNVAIRGFAGDGVSPHAKLLIDGIPANLHDGFIELDQLFPIGIDQIAVFKGTSDPRYGIYNIAGNYNVATRTDEARQAEFTLGSYNTQEFQGYLGDKGSSFSQSYAVGYRSNEGYRDHTDLDKRSLTGNWLWDVSDSSQLRVQARFASYEGDSPGYLSIDQAKDNPKQSASFASEDGGEKQNLHSSVHWSQELSNELFWTFKVYHQQFERERWVRFSEEGSLQDRYDNQAHNGLISTLSWDLNPSWSFDWGLDLEAQEVEEGRFGTIDQSRTRDTSNVLRDLDYTFNTLGSYVQLSHSAASSFEWNAAVRVDKLGGELTDKTDASHRDMYDFGLITQPKFNGILALNKTIKAFTSVGRSFQHPYGSAAYKDPGVEQLDVSYNDGFELGLQWQASVGTSTRLSGWQQVASDELISVDGVLKNVGATRRKGIDFTLTSQVNHNFSYWASYTLIQSKIEKSSEANAATVGNQLRGIPNFTSSLGLNYQLTKQLISRLHINGQGDYYVNEANAGGKYGHFQIINWSADYNTPWGYVKLQVNNLTDEYYEYVYDFSEDGSSTIHSPGDGINGSVSFLVDF